jgi:NAD-dependent SIR2 family protein deacetylase
MDPIIPLAISIADGPKTYAIFLGSGVSRGAGIPTGQEIFSHTIRHLYRLEENTEDLQDSKVKAWFDASAYKTLDFSKILEKTFPNLEERRRYLEKYFVGKAPSTAHRILAKLVKEGFVKVIVTTNFDDLIEKALMELSIPFDVVADAYDLQNVKPREQSSCRVMKLHGDWRKTNIKVTTDETEQLESELGREFQEIANRYGLTVIGYGGGDESIMSIVSRRSSSYGFYWIVREKLDTHLEELLQRQGARMIHRNSADEFMSELDAKIRAFLRQSDTDSPEILLAHLKLLFRNKDSIGIKDLISQQSKKVLADAQNLLRPVGYETDKAKIAEILGRLEEITDSLLVIGLFLIDNEDLEAFKILLQKTRNILSIIPQGNSAAVLDMPYTVLHNLLYLWGGFGLARHKIKLVKQLLNLQVTLNHYKPPQLLWQIIKVHHSETFGRNPCASFQDLANRYSQVPILLEFIGSDTDVRGSLAQFNFLLALLGVKEGVEIFSVSAGEGSVKAILDFIGELCIDIEFRDNIASLIFGEPGEAFWNELLDRMLALYKQTQLYNWKDYLRELIQLAEPIIKQQ